MKRILLLLTVLCCFTAIPLHAQVPAAYSNRLQTVLDSMCDQYHIKGASAAVFVPGRGIWKGVHGDSYAGHPITSNMAFALNSNTKTYTAALMLKLQEDGLLQLTDTIGKWIHNKTNISGQITIRQLLNHTSGLYNYTDTPAFADSVEANFSRIWQPAEMLAYVGKPLFPPGTSWSYSNTNYLLAGMIIAQVTGTPFEQAMRSKILTPQGLSKTWFYPQETPTETIPHFWFFNGISVVDGLTAFGYTPEGFYSSASSAGALFSTAEDNVNFWHKMIGGQIVNAASLSQWRQMVPLTSSIGYGLGVFRYRNFNEHVVYEHGGSGAGTLNENLADSASGVCISLLTNQDSADNDILFNEVVRALHQVTINPPTAVLASANSLHFTIYPNPAREYLRLSWNGYSFKNGRYTITDAAGRTIRSGLLGDKSSILVGDLQDGLYYLRLYDQKGADGVETFTVFR